MTERRKERTLSLCREAGLRVESRGEWPLFVSIAQGEGR